MSDFFVDFESKIPDKISFSVLVRSGRDFFRYMFALDYLINGTDQYTRKCRDQLIFVDS